VAVGVPGADRAALIPALARELPAFMIPRVLDWRDALPQTANGKLDRAGLYRELSALADKPAA